MTWEGFAEKIIDGLKRLEKRGLIDLKMFDIIYIDEVPYRFEVLKSEDGLSIKMELTRLRATAGK